MGIGTRVTVPRGADIPYRVLRDSPEQIAEARGEELWFPRLEAESAFRSGPRVLVTAFGASSKGMPIDSILDALTRDTQSAASGDGGSTGLQLSVDGSHAFCLRDVFVFQAILSAQGEGSEAGDLTKWLKNVKSEGVNGLRDVYVAVEPIVAHKDRLFSTPSWSGQYQFIARGDQAVARLRSMAIDVSGELGRRRVPIAYLYFPELREYSLDRSGQVGPENAGGALRIGLGLPDRAISALEVELYLNDRAAKYELDFFKNVPVEGRSSAGFKRIAAYEPRPRAVAVECGHLEEEEAADVMWMRTPARWGLIGDVLRREGAEAINGGSMAVLAGNLTACWIVKKGSGEKLTESIRRLLGDDAEGSVHTHEVRLLKGWSDRGLGAGVLWLDWKCPDAPGVFRSLVNGLTASVKGRMGRAPDYLYAVSRVQANRQTCAGRLSFSVPGGVEMSREWIHEIQAEALESLPPPAKDGAEVTLLRTESGPGPWG